VVALSLGVAPSTAAPTGSRAASVRQQGSNPGELAAGHIGRFRWAADATRGSGSAGATRPCIDVSLRYPHVPGDPPGYEQQVFGACGVLSAGAPPDIPAVSYGVGRKERTALALAFPSDDVTARLDLARRGARDVPLTLLDSPRADSLGVRAFRFWAHGFARRFCLRRITAFDAAGTEQYDSGPMSCKEQRHA